MLWKVIEKPQRVVGNTIKGVYEVCGRQRSGKSTLMMCDLICKMMPYYDPSDIYANFKIFIEGVNCMENAELMERIIEMRDREERHKVILFDEVGQELKARAYMDKNQLEIVNFAWQMLKRDIVLIYCSNPGNSADIILRLAAWQTVMPNYHKGESRLGDWIEVAVIFNYEGRWMSGIEVTGFQGVQELFDTDEPIG